MATAVGSFVNFGNRVVRTRYFSLGALVAAVVLLAIGFSIYWPRLGQSEEGGSSVEWLYTISDSDIEQVRFRNSGGDFAFVRTPDGWLFEEPEGLPVNTSIWGGVPLLLSGPSRTRLIQEEVRNPELYGMADPQTIVDIGLRGDREMQIRIGDRTPDGSSYYVMIGGRPQLFLVNESWGTVLGRVASDPPHPFWYLQVPASRITELVVRHQGTEVAVARQGIDQWIFDDASQAPVDPERWAGEFAPLLDGPAEQLVVGDMPSDLAAYGLDSPAAVVRVQYWLTREISGSLQTRTELQIGDKTDDGQAYYAISPEEGLLMSLDAAWVDGLLRLVSDPPRQ